MMGRPLTQTSQSGNALLNSMNLYHNYSIVAWYTVCICVLVALFSRRADCHTYGTERKKESDLTSLFQARLAYWTAIALSALLLPPPKQVPKGTSKSQPNVLVALQHVHQIPKLFSWHDWT